MIISGRFYVLAHPHGDAKMRHHHLCQGLQLSHGADGHTNQAIAE